MNTTCINFGFLFVVAISGLSVSSQALEIQHFVEGKEHADYFADATGLKIANDGTVYVTSEEDGSLLKIVDGKIEVFKLTPDVFSDSDLGGIDILADGRLVIANQDSGKLAIVDSQYQLKVRFSQSGDDPGELDKPIPVAVSVNNNIYVGDAGSKQISVFNDQGLFMHSFGRHDSGNKDLLKPTHISIDADENIYVLEGPSRFSVFDIHGNLIDRISNKDLKDQFDELPEFTALTADLNGTLYLGDYSSSQIVILDWRNRKVLRKFGALGQSRTQYRHISLLSVNNAGQIAILDNKNEKVEVFQLDETSFKKPQLSDLLRIGTSRDSNCRSIYAFTDKHNLCIKADQGNIVLLDQDGVEAGDFAAEIKEPTTLHSDSKRVAILKGNKMHVFDRDGKNLFTIGRYGTAPGGFQKPAHVFVHNNQFFVSDVGNNRVQIFSGDGQFSEEIKAETDDRVLFNTVGPIAVDSLGQLYVADKSEAGMIRVIDKNQKLVTSIGIEDESIHKVTSFHAIDIDEQDRLYVLASTEFNEYGVTLYKDLEPFIRFGAAGNNGTDLHFEEVSSMSVASTATNSIHINDSDLKRHYRFDLLEYPDAAFGLKIAANRSKVNLEWSSSRSPLITGYEIQASSSEKGPYKVLKTVTGLSETMPVKAVGNNLWFRIISMSGHGLPAAPSAARENQFQKMSKLFKAGEYQNVVGLSEKLLIISPDNADARELLATSLFNLKEYGRAISVFKELESNEAYRNKAIKYQVQAYFNLEQFLDARALIDEVLITEPSEVDPYLVCTQLSLELGDAIGAVTCAEDGLALHESHIELRYLLGRAYIEAGLDDEGLIAYQNILDSNPDDHAIRLKIADDLYAMHSYNEALENYDYVSGKLPDSGDAAVGKARSLLALDRDDEARAIAVKLSGKKSTKGDGNYLLGKLASKHGEYKKAVLRLTRASKEKPEFVDAWASLAEAYIQINQLPKGIKSLEQGIKKNSESYELYELAGKIQLEQEKYPEANAHLDKAVALQPQSLLARKLYSRGLFATRNYRSAAIHAEVAARIAPRNVDVLTLQADIANQQGKTGSAIEYLKTAISIDPASPELQHQIGRVYQDANLFDASRKHLEKAASINPAWSAPHVALGNLFSKRRLFDEAISAFERAIELDPSDENRAILNVAFSDRKKSLEFQNNTPQLVLADLNLQRVFSAAYKKYQDKPIGNVTLKNVSGTDYGNLKLSFQIREFMDFPTTLDIPKIAGNESQELDIKATFNNKILEVDEDTGVQVEVKITYLRDGQKDDISLTQPMTIYGKNAIVWGDPQMVGSFVTPKDDTLRNYVRQVVNAYQPEVGPLNDKLVMAMAYFSSLTASGTNYIIDPNTPFTELRDDQIDYVQFPRETLRLKSGDCDDLSVLISAGLENLGINTAFLEIPGHLFMMFDTGIPSDDAGLISQDGSLLAIKNNTVWIPLEATMVNTSFIEAWAEGARKYQEAVSENNLGIIDLSEAWKQYRPVTLRKASYSVDLPKEKRTRSLVGQAHKILLTKSIDRLVMPYQVMVTNNPRNIAARLQIAILYARFGLYQDAEIAFDALDELAPDNSAVQTNRGNLHFLQQDYATAISKYTRAARLDEEDGGIWINLSMAYFKSGDLKQAGTSFDQAIQLNAAFKKEYSAYAKLLSK